MEELIPIIMFLVIGAVTIAFIYFRSREKQMVIERGLDIEVIKEIFKRKETPYALLKAGIIVLLFGFGLGAGLMLEELTGFEAWIPFLIFVGAGLGFIIAHYAGKKAEERDRLVNKE